MGCYRTRLLPWELGWIGIRLSSLWRNVVLTGSGNSTKGSHEKFRALLLLVTAFVPLTQCLHYVESDGLVGSLFEDGGGNAFV